MEDGPAVELHILDTTSGQDEDEEQEDEPATAQPSGRQAQAALVAGLIRKIVGTDPGLMIREPQTGQMRPARYGDIVVLLRSPSVSARDYHRQIRAAGIPVTCGSTGLLDAIEVQDCLNLLKIIDNPYNDIELAAVLRGPLVAITDSQLVQISLGRRGTDQPLIQKVLEYCQASQDGELGARLGVFLRSLDRWRQILRQKGLSELIWQIYLDTGLPWRVLAQEDGQVRMQNLITLHDQAIWFEGFANTAGGPTLARFIEFIGSLEGSSAEDLGAISGQQKDAVRIISIHKAKGMEYPIVILADMESAFNLPQRHQDLLADPRRGVGVRVVDRAGRYKRPTAQHQLIALEQADAGIAEELRLFYVATTRARDRLIMTGAMPLDRCRAILDLGRFSCGSPGSWQVIRDLAKTKGMGNLLAWTLYACHDQPACFQALGGAGGQEPTLLEVHIHQMQDQIPGDIFGALQEHEVGPYKLGREDLSDLDRRLNWVYPYAQACSFKAKWSVTGLTGQGHIVELGPVKDLAGQDARQLGSATHLVMANLPLDQEVTADLVRCTLEMLVERGLISPVLAGSFGADGLVAFFTGPLGRYFLDKGNTVLREWPFVLAMRPSEIAGAQGLDQDMCVVEGVIDAIAVTKQGLVVVDFKTGRTAQPESLYERQVQLYARAASQILGMPVIGGWLYYLRSRQAVRVI
jgi:ATP-dependent helicase/nuclease subunit A